MARALERSTSHDVPTRHGEFSFVCMLNLEDGGFKSGRLDLNQEGMTFVSIG